MHRLYGRARRYIILVELARRIYMSAKEFNKFKKALKTNTEWGACMQAERKSSTSTHNLI